MACSTTRATGGGGRCRFAGETGWQPGAVVAADEHGAPVLLDGSQLLDQLGECVFVAEPVGQAGSARLVAGTPWSEKQAAAFVLDCVEHILGIVPGSADAELPDGGTLGAIIASARQYLDTGTGADNHKLGFVSRIAAARRLRRESTAIGDAAFTAAAQAEGQGVDILSDPAWETLAAARDAVLAAVEAVRHVAFPFLVERGTRRYEAHEEHKVAEVDQVDTPWGRFAVGGRGSQVRPILGGGPRRGRALPSGRGRPAWPGGGRSRTDVAGGEARGAAQQRIAPAAAQVA